MPSARVSTADIGTAVNASEVLTEEGNEMRSKLMRGVVAGLIGTSFMTAVQELADGPESSPNEEPSWENASAPAKVARKAMLAAGFDPPTSWIPFLTHAMHWGYGTTWGILYTLSRAGRSSGTLAEGVGIGGLVWAASYAELVPLGIYEPPWAYDAKTLGKDLSYHLAFGIGVVAAADALAPPGRR